MMRILKTLIYLRSRNLMAGGYKLGNLIHKLFYLLLQSVSYIVVFFYIVAIGTLLVMLDFLESKSISKRLFGAILIGVFVIMAFSAIYSGMELVWVL